MELWKVRIGVARALLESDSDSSLSVPFPGNWSSEGSHGVEAAKAKISCFPISVTSILCLLKNVPEPFGNLPNFKSATGISDTMECNPTLFKTLHHSLLTVSQHCCDNLQHSPFKQAATGIFRVYLNFLVMFCAASKLALETDLDAL